MTSLEERLHGRIDVDRIRETETLRVAKLEKLVEKYKLQLQDSRCEVQNLKAQLLGSGELKVNRKYIIVSRAEAGFLLYYFNVNISKSSSERLLNTKFKSQS